MKRLFLHRRNLEDNYTSGVFKYDGNIVCESMELPWQNNQRNISCIPGNKSYICQFDPEAQGGRGAFWVYNVIDRDSIQIHGANKAADIKGCIAPGYNFDYNNIYIYRSQDAMTKLFEIFELEQFELVILDSSGTTDFAKDFKVVSGDRRKWRDVGKIEVGDTIPVPAYDFSVEFKPGEKFWYKHGKGIKKAVWAFIGIASGVTLIQMGMKESGIALVAIFGSSAVKDSAIAVKNSKPEVDGKPGFWFKLFEAIMNFIKYYMKKKK